MSKKHNYAWDTSVILAWLCQDSNAPLADIGLVAGLIDSNRANLILSVNTWTEVLAVKHTAEQLERLRSF